MNKINQLCDTYFSLSQRKKLPIHFQRERGKEALISILLTTPILSLEDNKQITKNADLQKWRSVWRKSVEAMGTKNGEKKSLLDEV